jgi:hypothetical protein
MQIFSYRNLNYISYEYATGVIQIENHLKIYAQNQSPFQETQKDCITIKTALSLSMMNKK